MDLGACEGGSQRQVAAFVLPVGFVPIFLKLAVHAIPTLGTIVLFWFNFAKYFIGSTLAGIATPQAQSIDRLALQVTAKLYEVFVIVSLTTIIMDEVRENLIVEKGGLPLGLLFSHKQFSDFLYLRSHEFRAGCKGIASIRKRALFAWLIITCSLVALFVGPSSAILIIPTWHTKWPAAGASIWLNGDLSPSQLDIGTIGNELCLNYTDDRSILDTMDWTYASCPWAGFPHFKRYFDAPATGASHHVTYNSRTFVQDITLQWADGLNSIYAVDAVRTWAVSSNFAIAVFARHIATVNWPQALRLVIGPNNHGVRHQYAYALSNGTTASVEAQVPVVRTECFLAQDHTAGIPSDPPSENEQYLPFPIIPDYSGSRWGAYYIPVPIVESSHTATQWVDIPSSPSMTNYNSSLSHYPSAFLIIRNASTFQSDVTCSIQADWVPGTHVTSLVSWEITTNQAAQLGDKNLAYLKQWMNDVAPSGDSQNEPTLLGPSPEFQKPANWRQISISPTWLDILTPELSPDRPGWTTLASVLDAVLAQQDSAAWVPFEVYSESWHFEQINAVITSFVADGLSRLGWEENYAWALNRDTVFNTQDSSNASVSGWNYAQQEWEGVWSALIRKKATLLPNILYRHADGQNYTLQIALEGYGMRIGGLAYKLALLVVFIYIALVFYHIQFVVRKNRKSHGSDSWSSLIDMLVLAQTSNPPDTALRNTCAGVATHATLKLPVTVRSVKSEKLGREKVQLLVYQDGGQTVVPDEAYGVNRSHPVQSLSPGPGATIR
ncbi:uncharacterized protein LTR77_007123 [Saxophila tyrrhenica]|uniref:Uncharacterized protein n=1 Tax=Saxophila tyrrhenica TaxID=1690608 RepID=A0AAV9P743_9PEZI|nr:hypothetical protein LTR77_007123 [Saxophila tyrrhenica]